MIEIQIGADQNPEILIRTEVNLDQANKYNVGIKDHGGVQRKW